MNKIFIRLAVLLILLFVFAGIALLWWRDATSPAQPQTPESKIFIVQTGESVRSIATRLKNEGLIKDQVGFFLLVKLLQYDSKLQAGDFRLNPSMDTRTIIDELTHGTLDVWVTTLEGWRVEEIALKLAQDLEIPESEFLKVAREGYMFPDTYLLPKDASAAAVAKILFENFDKKVTPQMRTGFATQNLILDEAVVLASIVEREGVSDGDRPMIAGILLNRLHAGHPLQADATLQYALGYQSGEKSWWKKSLLDEDKKINSPYNTYKNAGLPPNPICNPGLGSLLAVANPAVTDYWYYLHDPQGGIHYATTLEEHNANIEKYLK